MFSLVIVFTLWPSVTVPNIDTEHRCVRAMTNVQRLVSPERIVFMLCMRTGEANG